MKSPNLLKSYSRLLKYFGPQGWWPTFCKKSKAHVQFEICLGAILTQNTAWKNVVFALQNLHAKNIFSPQSILKTKPSALKNCIRPAGYYNQKEKKIRIFCNRLIKEFNGDLDLLFKMKKEELRKWLLSVWGIGRETADSIILYAARKPIFVIDTYTKRMLKYFDIEFDDYDDYRNLFESQLPKSAKMWNEYHALIVAWGKINNSDGAEAQKLLGLKNKKNDAQSASF